MEATFAMFPAILRKIGWLLCIMKMFIIFLGIFKATSSRIPTWCTVSDALYLMLISPYEVSSYPHFPGSETEAQKLTHPGSNRKWQNQDSNSDL